MSDPQIAFDALVREARVRKLEEQLEDAKREIEVLTQERDLMIRENDELSIKVADCQQLAKGEQSLLDSLKTAYAQIDRLEQRLRIAHGDGGF